MAKHKPEDLVVIPKSVLDDMYRHFGGSVYLYLGETKPLKPLLENAFDKGVITGLHKSQYLGDKKEKGINDDKQEYLKQLI